jgi:hypothetical protein
MKKKTDAEDAARQGGGQRRHLATASGATEGSRGALSSALSSAHRDSSVCDTTMDGASVLEEASPLSSPLSARSPLSSPLSAIVPSLLALECQVRQSL